jgi:predicted AlkP superfamily pyrophosphatase or phosphodiesterase
MRRILLLLFFIAYQVQINAQLPEDEVLKKTQSILSNTNAAWVKEQPYVVLISIDGFRYDYAEKFGAINILNFMKNGVSSAKMIPSFPSKTFPNHYTIVTGLYPINHGIIGNEFYSRERKEWYRIKDKEVGKDGTWYGGKPLWVLAEQAGMLSASFFWIGSEANIQNTYPNYYYPYKGAVPNEFRFRQTVDWLKMTEEERPHFISVYFSLVDDAGHAFGPDSEQTKASVLKIDSLFGDFLQALNQVNLPVNVVLVSDHGMAAIKYGIVLKELVDLEGCLVSGSFPPMIYCDDSAKVNKISRILKEDGRIQVYRPDELPERLHMSSNDRIGDLILYTEAPTVILDKPKPVRGGTHGFDPYMNDEMNAFFAASGPAFKSQFVIAPFGNVHIYPLIAEILGLKITDKIDSDIEVLKNTLKSREEN